MNFQENAEREEKQKYLRENIPAELYEDFAEFCVSYAGSIDIDSWTFSYVKEVTLPLFSLLRSFIMFALMCMNYSFVLMAVINSGIFLFLLI